MLNLDEYIQQSNLQKRGTWTFGVMERQNSSTERASPMGSAQCLNFSRRRSYIPAAVPVSIMSSDVFVQQFLPVFFADSTMNPDLCLRVREEPLKSVVGVRETGLV